MRSPGTKGGNPILLPPSVGPVSYPVASHRPTLTARAVGPVTNVRRTKIGRLAVAIVIAATILGHETTAQEPAKQVTSSFNVAWLKAVVSIEQVAIGTPVRPVGTGFLVLSQRHHIVLVTARHVVVDELGKPRTGLSLRLNDASGQSDLIGEAELASLGLGGWFISADADVACRFVFRRQTSDVLLIPMDQFLPTDQIQPGAPAVVIGFTLGLRSERYATPVLKRASVALVQGDQVLLDVSVFPGNSGGPVVYVPTISLGKGLTSNLLNEQRLIGLVSEAISYQEVAVSEQTKRPRVTFEQNAGLARVVPADAIGRLLQRDDVRKLDDSLK